MSYKMNQNILQKTRRGTTNSAFLNSQRGGGIIFSSRAFLYYLYFNDYL